MEIKFHGKRALVTGAGKGIGRLLTVKLAEAGAEVIAISRTQSDLDSLKQLDSTIQTMCLDIGDWESTKRALRDIGPINLLVNNAGILELKEYGEISQEEVDRIFNVNVKSIINITQIIANEMKSHGIGGSIVNVSSTLGLFGAPFVGIYCASKGAVELLTRSMAVEFGPHKIRVNSVNPTLTRTNMPRKVGTFDEGNNYSQMVIGNTPLGRIAEPEDIIGPIFFLLSDYAAMVTGEHLVVDGGFMASCR